MKKLLVYLPLALALTAGAPLAANESNRYGAFAIDVDVWAYAFAGGERTQDEADEAALSLCAEEGAERCEIKYQYTGSRCGAAAIAEERDYLAWGFGHAESRAEAIDEAISACKSENTSGAACRKMSVACGALHPADDPQRALKKAEREQRKAERALKTAERKLEKEQTARQKAQADLKAAQTERRMAQSEQKKAAREQRKAESDLKAAQTAQQTAEAAKEKWKTAWEEEKTGREWAEYYLKQHGGDPAQAQAAAKGQAGKKKGGFGDGLNKLLGVANLAVGNVGLGMTLLADTEEEAEAHAKRHMGAELGVSTATMDSVFDALDAPAQQTAQAGPSQTAPGEAPYGYTAAAAWWREAPPVPGLVKGRLEALHGMALGESSPDEAKRKALSLCKQATGGRDCNDNGLTTARCTAFAEGKTLTSAFSEPLLNFGAGTSNDTQAAASDMAVSRCQDFAKNEQEQVKAAGYEASTAVACRVVIAGCVGGDVYRIAEQKVEEAEAEEDKPRYGAVAFTPEQGAYALAVGYETQAEADKAAWGLCNDEKARGENFCEVQAAINAPCAAIAKVNKGQTNISGDIWKPGIGSGDTKAGAIEAAISECQGQPDGAYGRPSCSLHSAVCADAEAHANIRGHLATSGEDAVRDIRGHIANLPEPEFEQKADGKGAAAPAKEKDAPPANKKTTETPEIFREVSKMYGSEEATE